MTFEQGADRQSGRLRDRVAVVSGVGSTIGRASAISFAKEGAAVVVLDPDPDVASDVATEVMSHGGDAGHLRFSGGDQTGPAAVASLCAERWGRVDVLFDCTAILDFWETSDDDPSYWKVIWDYNVGGPLQLARTLAPLMARTGGGSMIFLSSIDGLFGNPTYPIYSATKGALIPLTHVLAHTYATDGIRVNCIATAGIVPVGTGPRPQSLPTVSETLLAITPLGRTARPEEVASVAVFYASDESSYLTGTVLPFDGGRTVLTPGTGRH